MPSDIYETTHAPRLSGKNTWRVHASALWRAFVGNGIRLALRGARWTVNDAEKRGSCHIPSVCLSACLISAHSSLHNTAWRLFAVVMLPIAVSFQKRFQGEPGRPPPFKSLVRCVPSNDVHHADILTEVYVHGRHGPTALLRSISEYSAVHGLNTEWRRGQDRENWREIVHRRWHSGMGPYHSWW